MPPPAPFSVLPGGKTGHEESNRFSREEALRLVAEFYRVHPEGSNRQLMQYMRAGSLTTAKRWKQEYTHSQEA